jgi:hypothetical protein
MADWDADDFEPDVNPTPAVAVVSDKWDGEDEDDDVKVRDNGDDGDIVKHLTIFRMPGMPSLMRRRMERMLRRLLR